MASPSLRKSRGFSLVELMVVVAIIGVLAAIALPQFRTFQTKARQAEAKTNLSNIFTLEQTYQAEFDTYAVVTAGSECSINNPAANPIGFYLNCGGALSPYNNPASTVSIRYLYNVAAGAAGINSSFLATATSGATTKNRVAPGCKADVWTIDQTQTLTAVNNSVTSC